jgi:hypothetical protein
VGKSDEKRPTGGPKLRWKNNIKTDLQEVLWRAWTGLIWLRIEVSGGLFRRRDEQSGSIKCGEFVD